MNLKTFPHIVKALLVLVIVFTNACKDETEGIYVFTSPEVISTFPAAPVGTYEFYNYKEKSRIDSLKASPAFKNVDITSITLKSLSFQISSPAGANFTPFQSVTSLLEVAGNAYPFAAITSVPDGATNINATPANTNLIDIFESNDSFISSGTVVLDQTLPQPILIRRMTSYELTVKQK